MLTRALRATGVAVLLPLLAMHPAQSGPGRCAVVDGTGQCLVAAADPGRPGGPRDPDRRGEPRRTPGPERRGSAPPADRPDAADAPALAGVATGGGLAVQPFPAALAAEVAETPAVAPAVLAQRAVSNLTLRAPTIRLSSAQRGFVGVPVWLWVERGVQATGPATAVATAGNARVQATGRLVAVEWDLGPAGARMTCAGPGTPWNGQSGPSPDCGYVYQQRSLPERTGGTGRWTVTATGVWQVGWVGVTDGGPVAGQQTLRLSSAAMLPVGEVQVLVSGGG